MKYDSFKEYLQLNYLGVINKALEEWIQENELYEFETYIVNNIKVTGVKFTKSRKDKVEFIVSLVASYDLIDINKDIIVHKRECFIYKMYGSFKNGFKGKENDIKVQEEELDEKLSKGLVPIISLKELDTYAAKFLKEYCKEALEIPMKVDLNNIFKDKEINVYFSNLGEAYGKVYFDDDKAYVYNKNLELELKEIKAGTILIDIDKFRDRPSGAYRNTVIHEAVHWFFHRNYFELRLLLNDEMTSYSCFKKDNCIYDDDIYWMEWQARHLAPRILMPKKTSIMKLEEIEKEIYEKYKDVKSNVEIYEMIIREFARFFEVSIQSARIRIIELGRKYAEGVLNYIDDQYVDSFVFKENILKKNQSFTISSKDLMILLSSNIMLRNKLEKEEYVYINKMIVINNEKYVDNKNYKLTEYALNNVQECCLIFNTYNEDYYNNEELNKLYFLFNINDSKNKYIEVDIKQSEKLLKQTLENTSHFETHKHNLPDSFNKTLEYHYKKAKENNIIRTYEQFAEEADIDVKIIREYKNGDREPNKIDIIKMGLALRLSSPYIINLLEKADKKMNLNSSENTFLFTIIFSFPRVGLEKIYKELKSIGKENILNISYKYLEFHNLL